MTSHQEERLGSAQAHRSGETADCPETATESKAPARELWSRERLKIRAEPLRDAADHVPDVLATDSNLAAAASGLRVQGVILVLTIVVLGAAVARVVLGMAGNLGGAQTITLTVTPVSMTINVRPDSFGRLADPARGSP